MVVERQRGDFRVEGFRVTCFKLADVLKGWALSSEQLTCQTWKSWIYWRKQIQNDSLISQIMYNTWLWVSL